MKRRNFLKYAGLGSGGLLINGLPVKAFATEDMLTKLTCNYNDRAMVIIQLKGGNDGINNLIPTNQFDTYAQLRPSIKFQENQLITLDSTLSLENQIGLNPNLLSFKEMYDNGMLSITQGVSYPQPNKSHFKSTDLMLTAGDGTPENFKLNTGWLGRYLDYRFPTYSGVPTSRRPDPLGIQLGDKKPSLGFHSESEHRFDLNLSGQDPLGFYSVVQGFGGVAWNNIPDNVYGEELAFIMNVENNVNSYAERISSVFANGSNSTTYPETGLANQLKTVARLLDGGSQTKVFMLQLGGFDTHANQTNGTDATQGRQAELLEELSNAVKAFQNDLESIGLADKVLTVTFSEFGRKATENGNYGTDHGTLAPMYVIGKNVNPGVVGTNIDLSNLDETGAPNINQIQHDYRQVFGSLMQDWLAQTTLV